ncbi:hypothetical protein NQF86_00255 [Bombella sp. TMW 2.2543]|uniref:Uncharacterized protein n=1 Tax=Bombella pluederhausensis TaxID=2967336 RepID=A0ABT3WFI3_9PROT|nr:hypothetical protein [Bombella pluederhausensis]MCX5617104.1 hypothetical protein [Bombella pluederhausensis]
MNPYFAGGFILTLLAFLTGLMAFGNRAGRNSANVRSSQQIINSLKATLRTAQAMLDTRTNAIRTRPQLMDILKRGRF